MATNMKKVIIRDNNGNIMRLTMSEEESVGNIEARYLENSAADRGPLGVLFADTRENVLLDDKNKRLRELTIGDDLDLLVIPDTINA